MQKEENAKATILATGERCLIIAMKIAQKLKEQGKMVDVVNARFVKPLDVELLKNLQSKYVITMEDNVFLGGFGSAVNGELIKLEKDFKIKNFAYRDEFIPQGSIAQLQSDYGVNCVEIENYLTEVLK
jgi:1-deoxy-D-xylulose-5-phosphate synthase